VIAYARMAKAMANDETYLLYGTYCVTRMLAMQQM